MAEILRKFGKYFLLDHIAQGGMAEIYRARLATPGEAGRLLAIKKVLAGFGSNSEFAQMFQSEIKVTLAFNHPNIVQVYECGEEEKQPYIAMELIDGRNLRQFITRFSELRQTIQPDMAAYIIEQAASALHYAHSFRDKISGEPLNVVHRDIKPQNILISYDGTVKVIDFGIAKAATNDESTRAGVIKGTINYLSPEQLSGDPLDGRSDIFALGIVLWELLTGEKLFKGDNDLAILKQIESSNLVKTPSTINPAVPKELDYIVIRALAKQREKRFQNAGELQRKLHKFLYEYNPDFNPADLSYLAKDLFQNVIVEDRKKIQRLNDKAEQLLKSISAPLTTSTIELEIDPTITLKDRQTPAVSSPPPPREEATARVETAAKGGATVVRATRDIRTIATSPPSSTVARLETEIPPPHVPTQKPQIVRGSAVVNATTRSTRAQASRGTQTIRSTHQKAREPSESGKMIRRLGVIAAAVLAIAFAGPSFGLRVPIVSDALFALISQPQAELMIDGNDPEAVISIDGKIMAQGVPNTLRKLPTGKPLNLSITSSNDQKHTQTFTLLDGKKTRMNLPWGMPENRIPAQTSDTTTAITQLASGSLVDGTTPSIELQLEVHPSGAGNQILISTDHRTIQVDPSPGRGRVRVPLDAPLNVKVERPGFRPHQEDFHYNAAQYQSLKETLKSISLEPTQYGILTLRVNAANSTTARIQVTRDNYQDRWERTLAKPIDSERFPAGKYVVILENELLGWSKTLQFELIEGRRLELDAELNEKTGLSP